jgi:hypothetical protein
MVAPTDAAGAAAANGRRRRGAATDWAKRAHDARAGVGEAYDLVAPSVKSFGRLCNPTLGLRNALVDVAASSGRHCNCLQLHLCALWFEGYRPIDFAAMDDAASMVSWNLQVARVRLLQSPAAQCCTVPWQ